jgi:type II secretory pathway pseudopilin PulG
MKTARRNGRTGFTGIEIILVLIIGAIVSSMVASCNSTAFDEQQSRASSQMSGTLQGVKNAAQAGTAVLRFTREAATEAPDTIAPDTIALDTIVPAADPAVGDGALEILEGLLEGL